MADATLSAVLDRLAELDDPKIRAVNANHGDDHSVNLSKLRALAKELKAQPDLARELWQAGDTNARLLALLVARPKQFDRDDLDTMLREAGTPKVQDWLVANIVKKAATPRTSAWPGSKTPTRRWRARAGR